MSAAKAIGALLVATTEVQDARKQLSSNPTGSVALALRASDDALEALAEHFGAVESAPADIRDLWRRMIQSADELHDARAKLLGGRA